MASLAAWPSLELGLTSPRACPIAASSREAPFEVCCADKPRATRAGSRACALKSGVLDDPGTSSESESQWTLVNLDDWPSTSGTPRACDSGSAFDRMVPTPQGHEPLPASLRAATSAAGKRRADGPPCPPPAGGGAAAAAAGKRVRLMDGTQPRSWTGVMHPFKSVVRAHTLDGGLNIGAINAAIRELEGARYPWQ